MPTETGLFAVRLETVGGSICAMLTGEHWEAGDAELAKSAARDSVKKALAKEGSPIYLVSDAVVELAFRAVWRAFRDEIPDCHDGENGKPCGSCRACEAARREAFTDAVIGSLELQGNDFGKRLDDAVRSVIGLTWLNAPWTRPMTQDEVLETFRKLGVKPKKGKR